MRSPIEKIVAHRATNYPNAYWMWQEFCRENHQSIVDCRKYDNFRTRMTNGEIHYFVPMSIWFEWTKGRTYWLDDELYCNGYKVKETGDEDKV